MLNSLCIYLSQLCTTKIIIQEDIKNYIEQNYPNYKVYLASKQRPFDCRICDNNSTYVTHIPNGTKQKVESYK